MRFIIRLVGVILFAAAFVILVIDGTRSIAGNDLYLSSLADSVTLLWPTGVESAEAFVDGLAGSLWDPAGVWLFAQPGFVVLGIAGLLLMLIGRAPAHVVRPRTQRY